MKISIRWIREFCPFPLRQSPREIGVRFSLATAEVEGVEARGEALRGIVAARVIEVRAHPAADSLVLARIEAGKAGGAWKGGNAGKDTPLEVVCGAPNVRAGLVVPWAMPGAVVGGREIAVAAIRGVDSPGMLLSAAELGATDEAGGLLELPPDTPPGTSITALLPELDDIVLEVDNKSLTHRPDLWGHYGIAREFSVIYGTPLKPYEVDEALAEARGESGIRVEIEAEATPGAPPRCPRYCGLRIDGVIVGPSPDWLRHRLHAVGLRPISNVVDVTNHVMLELGQPLHAFDAARIRRGLIRVRRAAQGETMRLLDGSEARLVPEDLVIADGEGPVALAGVMGGEGSAIGPETRSIFLEAANFSAAGVRRTSLRTARTDSSARFEKSLDPAWPRTGILRAAKMILELSPGARITGRLQDVGAPPAPPIVIRTSPAAITSRLGTSIPSKRVRGILTGLGFDVRDAADPGGTAKKGGWDVSVPSWRATKDISIPEDLVEEVGRIQGYGKIEPFAPLWPVQAPAPNETRRLERRAKTFLALHGGLVEAYTYSMVGVAHCRAFGLDPEEHLRLRNPMSEEMDRMRREIVPLHLEKARENQRFARRFGLFELGRVYRKDRARLRAPELPRESTRIAGVLSAERKDDANFHELRHVALSLLEHLGAEGLRLEPVRADRVWIHPVVGARVLAGEVELGQLYRVHPEVEARLELVGDVLAFDLDFDAVAALPPRDERYRKLARFPFVTFDVAVVAPERTPAAGIAAVIRRGAGEALRGLEAFDVYRGAGIPVGTKSVAFHVAVGAEDHTLGTAEAEGLRGQVIAALQAADFQLRG